MLLVPALRQDRSRRWNPEWTRPMAVTRRRTNGESARLYPSASYCFCQSVPFDHWMRLSGRMTPSMFHGAPTLSVVLLDNRPWATSPLSFFMSNLLPLCATVKVCPDHWHELGSGWQR